MSEPTEPKTSDPVTALVERLTAEVRRLSGCLLVIAGAEDAGNGSLRTAAYEAATMGATVDNLANKLGPPVPREGWAVDGWEDGHIRERGRR
jgi:hypothetical protein